MKAKRTDRLSSEFQKAISDAINKGLRQREPSLSAIISVTDVDVAPDLSVAKVFLSIFDSDEEKKKKSLETIKENAGFLRHEISGMRIKKIPSLVFSMDESLEYGERIDNILAGLDIKKDEGDD